MKIEKLNDHQIRCTLTRQDLDDRELKLSELAYGNDKVKQLFQEMMQQAADDFGFEANNIPLMIEAIPVNLDTLVLIITKVEDPEELDTRFARFAPDSQSAADAPSFSSLKLEGADDILSLFRKIREAKKAALEKAASETDKPNPPEEEPVINLTRLYGFDRLDDVIHAARSLRGSYRGTNCLYKNPQTSEFCLFLEQSMHTPEEFNRICNTISEYAYPLKNLASSRSYLQEHGKLIIADEALQKLAGL